MVSNVRQMYRAEEDRKVREHIAMRLLRENRLPLRAIAKETGLTEADLNKLRQEM